MILKMLLASCCIENHPNIIETSDSSGNRQKVMNDFELRMEIIELSAQTPFVFIIESSLF